MICSAMSYRTPRPEPQDSASQESFLTRAGGRQHYIPAICGRAASRARALLGGILAFAAIGTAGAQAQTYTVLHTFTEADGQYPSAYGHLVRDLAGNLYGTTEFGGASGQGVVFKLDPRGTETVLHNFTGGADGGVPYAALIRDLAGDLYGTTTFRAPPDWWEESHGGVPVQRPCAFRAHGPDASWEEQ